MSLVAYSFLILCFFTPQITYALNCPQEKCTSAVCLPNPICARNITELALQIMRVMLGLVDIAALVMFIVGGFRFMVSMGNTEKIKKAKDTLLWAVVGILLITFSYSLMQFIFDSVQNFTS